MRNGGTMSGAAKRIGWGILFVEFVIVPCWIMVGSIDGVPFDDSDIIPSMADEELGRETWSQYDGRVSGLWDGLEDFQTNNVVETAFSSGNHSAAIEMVSNQLQTGSRILRSATSMDEYCAGAGIIQVALSKVRIAMGKQEFPDDAMDTFEKTMDAIQGADMASCKRAIQMDYAWQKRRMENGDYLAFISNRITRIVLGSYMLHLNDTLSLEAVEARKGMAALDTAQCPWAEDQDDRDQSGWIHFSTAMIMPNCGGLICSSGFKTEIRNSIHRALHEMQRSIEAARITIAVTRYRNKHGKPPKNADELVSGYLKAIPTDPCSHQPVRIDVEKNSIQFGLDDGWHVYPLGETKETKGVS